jgi:hypothetical protein
LSHCLNKRIVPWDPKVKFYESFLYSFGPSDVVYFVKTGELGGGGIILDNVNCVKTLVLVKLYDQKVRNTFLIII